MRVNPKLVGALLVVALATLMPGDAAVAQPSRCIICGSRGLADAILNLMLFVPVGAALGYQRFRLGRTLLFAAAVSIAIELLQLVIPGRDPSAGDPVFNTLGAALGSFLPTLVSAWRATFPRRASLFAALGVALAVAVISITGYLLHPDLPHRQYYGQWTPTFANAERYQGRVTAAFVGDLAIQDHVVNRSDELRRRLLRGDVLDLHAVSGPRAQSDAFVFNIYDDTEREVLSIIADQRDLLIRYRVRANRFRLDQPTHRVEDALASVGPRQPWSLELQLVDGGICARSPTVIDCPLGSSIARGWSVLVSTDRWPWVSIAFDVVWLALLFAPAGTYLTGRRSAAWLTLATVAGLIIASHAVGLLPIRTHEIGAGLLGLYGGALVRRFAGSKRVHA